MGLVHCSGSGQREEQKETKDKRLLVLGTEKAAERISGGATAKAAADARGTTVWGENYRRSH